jgi:hypothetical protein
MALQDGAASHMAASKTTPSRRCPVDENTKPTNLS